MFREYIESYIFWQFYLKHDMIKLQQIIIYMYKFGKASVVHVLFKLPFLFNECGI